MTKQSTGTQVKSVRQKSAAPPQTIESRAQHALEQAGIKLAKLHAEYDHARKTLAFELTDGEGPTWVSSSSETEWLRLRGRLWEQRDLVKALRFVLTGEK